MSQPRPVDWESFGHYVEERRLAQGLSIADCLRRSGLSRTKWADVEKNRGTRPTRETLLAIAKGLGDPAEELLQRAGIAYTAEDPSAVEPPPAPDDRLDAIAEAIHEQGHSLAELKQLVSEMARRVNSLRLPPGT